MRLRLAPAFLVITACAGHYRTELVGQGRAAIVPRGSASAPAGGGIQLARGTYDLALRFDVPHAQIVDWVVSCDGADVAGSVGESFDAYRARRIAQLRAQRDQDRRNVASLTGAVLGAVTPTVTAHAETPTTTVDARVSGQALGGAAGNAIANATIDDVIELPPGDVGQGRLQTNVHLSTAADGTCRVTATADDQSVVGGFEVTRVRDLDAEARLRIMAANTAARQVRTQLTTQLVGYGADATLRRRQLEAQAHVRIEAQAAVVARHDAEIAIEVRRRGYALNARAELRAWLVMCGADPDRRARLAMQARAEREAREAHARLEIELRDRANAEREAAVAAFEARQQELALAVRANLRTYLVSLGARERPPMPALVVETPTTAPFEGAVWVAGKWIWDGGAWTWQAGGWRDTGRFHDAGGEGGEAIVGVGTGSNFGGGATVEIRDHRSEPPSASPTVRDHRSTPTRDATPVVRDHRNDDVSSSKTKDTPTVRDHRR